jgi:hypothetical protein
VKGGFEMPKDPEQYNEQRANAETNPKQEKKNFEAEENKGGKQKNGKEHANQYTTGQNNDSKNKA